MKGRGEGVGREVQSSPFEVIAHRDQDQPSELQLSALIIRPAKYAVIDLHPALGNLLQQRDQARFELRKDRPEPRNGRSRLIEIQERIVRRVLVSQIRRFFAFEREDGAEMGEEQGELVLCLGLNPDLLCERTFPTINR